jgi:hypothetical protein
MAKPTVTEKVTEMAKVTETAKVRQPPDAWAPASAGPEPAYPGLKAARER